MQGSREDGEASATEKDDVTTAPTFRSGIRKTQ